MTALHLVLAAVRKHRASGASLANPFVLPSFVLAIAPWVFPSVAGLVAGVAAHLAWVALCEWLAPAPATTPLTASATNRPRPATSPMSPAARPASASARQPGVAGTRKRAATRDFVPAPVLAVITEAADIKTFRLGRPAGFDFNAGQFVPVRVLVDGKPHVRCYSISSSPDVRGYLEISVRRQGLVSSMLHASLRAGSHVSINAPAGSFTYPDGDDRPLALLAGGIGITPLLSMLRHAVSTHPMRPVTVLYSARDRDSLAFLSELRVVAERHPQVRVAVTLSSDPDAGAPWRHGRIDAALLRQYVADPVHTIFCVCGPDSMMNAMQELLRAEGVPAAQIRSEHFSTAMAAVSLHGAASAAAPRPVSPAGADHGSTVTFATSGRRVPVNPNQTLLDAAECEGVEIMTSCRAGVCQACRTRLLDGEADCRSSVLDPDDRAAGFVLPCVTYAVGDCTLDA